jgi:hypothetical protein
VKGQLITSPRSINASLSSLSGGLDEMTSSMRFHRDRVLHRNPAVQSW